MSKESSWKGFEQLLVSPVVSGGRSARKQQGIRRRSGKRGRDLNRTRNDDDWEIDDNSDEDAAGCIHTSNATPHASFTPSLAQSLNPAEVTIDRRDQSDSEVEDIPEDAFYQRKSQGSSTDSSGSDDCLEIHCRKTKMTRLKFVDKNDLKRRRITDEMDVSFAASSSKTRTRQAPIVSCHIVSPKQFKTLTPISSLKRSKSGATGMAKSTQCWKSFDETFTEQEPSLIEELSSSPENEDDRGDTRALLNIEDLPSSAEEPSSRMLTSLDGQTAASSRSFYLTSPDTHSSRSKIHPKGSPLGTLSIALNEKRARQSRWQQAITSGALQPELIVKIDSIERIYGRVMVRFYTTTKDDADGVEERIENIIFMDQSDRQLKTILAGMEVALETDDSILPHLISRNKMVHLGVTKLCVIRPSR
uniref:Uncharacterized protein n=1 Tax=Anopheles dirus TaxID=7168 RepID=A0A182NLB2_9DIPT